MKFSDINTKTADELQEMLKEKRAHMRSLLFERSQQSLKDFSQIRKSRREIAQILTAIHKNQYNISA